MTPNIVGDLTPDQQHVLASVWQTLTFKGAVALSPPDTGLDVAGAIVMMWPGVRLTISRGGQIEWICFGDVCPEPGHDEDGYASCSSRNYSYHYLTSILRANYALDIVKPM